MNDWRKALRYLTLLSQLGLSLVVPLLMCILFCWWLNTAHGVGVWVYIPGFFFGLGGSFTTAWRLYKTVTAGEDKHKDRKKGIFFNSH